MKKLILTALAVAGVTAYSYGQGVITLDSSLAGATEINGVVNNSVDINAELLYFNGSSFAPVVTLLLSQASGDSAAGVNVGATEPASGDITFDADGTLYDANGNAYIFPAGYPSGTVVTLEVEGWLGNITYAQAAATGTSGITATFTEALSNATSPILQNTANMPLLNLVTVPEPATFVLAGLGIASLLAFRRRK